MTQKALIMEWKYSIAIQKWYLPLANNELWITVEKCKKQKSIGVYYIAEVFGKPLRDRYDTLEQAQAAARQKALILSRRISNELSI